MLTTELLEVLLEMVCDEFEVELWFKLDVYD